jgi:hypothetical protein
LSMSWRTAVAEAELAANRRENRTTLSFPIEFTLL